MSLDIEHPQNWTDEQREAFKKNWEAAIPKFTGNNNFKCTIIYGTAGHVDNSLEEQFYSPK